MTSGDKRMTISGAIMQTSAAARPVPSSLYQNVTAHPSTASVQITVLLYNGPLLCSFNVPTYDTAQSLHYVVFR